MDLDHRGHPEGVGEIEVETNYSQFYFYCITVSHLTC